MKKLFLVFVSFIFSFNLFAVSLEGFSFQIEPFFGITNGKLGEYLFSQNSENRYMVSSLEWNITPGVEVGGNLQVGFKNFFIGGGVKTLLPSDCGYMYDSDYNSTLKKNYCTLENNLNRSLDAFAEISYSFNFDDKFSILPCIQANYAYYFFSAENGSGYFGSSDATGLSYDVSYDDKFARYASSVSGIDYERQSIYSFIGLILKYKKENLQFQIGTYISPFTFTDATDYHRDERNIEEDLKADFYLLERTISYFSRIKEQVKFQYDIKSFFGINFSATFFYGGISQGLFATNKYRSSTSSGIFSAFSDWVVTGQPCGENIILFTCDLGCVFKF